MTEKDFKERERQAEETKDYFYKCAEITLTFEFYATGVFKKTEERIENLSKAFLYVWRDKEYKYVPVNMDVNAICGFFRQTIKRFFVDEHIASYMAVIPFKSGEKNNILFTN